MRKIPNSACTPVDNTRGDDSKVRAVIAAARAVVTIMKVYEHERLPTPLVGALMQLRHRLDEL